MTGTGHLRVRSHELDWKVCGGPGRRKRLLVIRCPPMGAVQHSGPLHWSFLLLIFRGKAGAWPQVSFLHFLPTHPCFFPACQLDHYPSTCRDGFVLFFLSHFFWGVGAGFYVAQASLKQAIHDLKLSLVAAQLCLYK